MRISNEQRAEIVRKAVAERDALLASRKHVSMLGSEQHIAAVNSALDELASLRAVAERMAQALEECAHQTHSLRVWNGQTWLYHPPQAGRIAEIAKAARAEWEALK